MLLTPDMTRGLFFSNHASNYLPLRVKMPADKEKALRPSMKPSAERFPSNRNG